FRRGKAFRRPYVTSHEVQTNKDDGSQGGPQQLQLGITVRVIDLFSSWPVAILPDQVAQGDLRRHENNAHHDISQGELVVDPCRRRGSSMGKPPGFCHKKICADEGYYPDKREKSEAHLPDLQGSWDLLIRRNQFGMETCGCGGSLSQLDSCATAAGQNGERKAKNLRTKSPSPARPRAIRKHLLQSHHGKESS